MASPTPAEIEAMLSRARELCPWPDDDDDSHGDCACCERIATALATVAAEEREACAQVVLAMPHYMVWEIAEVIRARKP